MVYVAIIAAVLAIFWWWAGRPKYHRRIRADDLERFIDSFVDKMGNGSVLFIEEEGSDRFLQFAIYEEGNGRCRLRFGYPDAEWAHEKFSSVKTALKDAGFEVSLERTKTVDVPTFLIVDAIGAPDAVVKRAANIAEVALSSMGIFDTSTFRVHSEGTWIGPRASRRTPTPLG